MNSTWYRGIAVGVDGSEESLAALDWAAHATDLHGARLTVVATYPVPATLAPWDGDLASSAQEGARCAAQAARARLGQQRPGDRDVEMIVQPGSAAHALSQRSTTCDLVVVGRRGLSTLDRALLGSTSSALAASAPGAVAVVPAGATTGNPSRIRVRVGRDDGPDPLGAAFAEAAVRGCPLEVLHVTSSGPTSSVLPHMDPVGGTWRAVAAADLADQVARWAEQYPQVTYTMAIRHGDPVSMVLHELTPDDLVIVGGRRHPPTLGRVLHSVPDAVLRAAPCPVVMVHAPASGHLMTSRRASLATWKVLDGFSKC
ncbi:universal stress protein [Promicromonospora sp. Populi]|uniref:universal stress protein n=1 Tax=Promicromonospora sp. Populi TaxID=3239420 RepID=UPI0034E25A23